MNEQFLKLPKDKRDRILYAALDEFAKQGYENASTNRIVKEAGIGKGMLFYYFNSKQELFDDLIEYSLSVITKEYLDRIDIDGLDLVNWLSQVAEIKLNYFLQYPKVNDFLSRLMTIDGIPERHKVPFERLIIRGHQLIESKIKASVNYFREDIDPNDAAKLVYFMMKGYRQDILERMRGKKLSDINVKPLWDEFYRYLDLLKTVFYKD